MKKIFCILLGSILVLSSIEQELKAQLVKPCIRVNNLVPTTGVPDYYNKCKTRFVQLSVINCGTNTTISPSSFTYSWVNITTGSFTYTSPTVNTNEAGRWIVTIWYTDTPSGITYIEKDTLDLINYADIPFAINNGDATYSHCPYDPLNFTATANNQIINNSYKWYINNTATIDTTVSVESSGTSSWATVIITAKYVTVTATDLNGCKVIDNIFAPLLPTPIAPNIGATHVKCPGASITLTAAFQAGNTYSWDGGPFTTTNTFTTSAIGKHWVTVQRGLGCKLADTTFISNYTAPAVYIGNDTSLCYMESGNLTALVTGTPGFTYSWSPAVYFSNPNIANPTISIATITTIPITLTVTDGNTCTNTASKNVTHLAQGSNPYLNVISPDIEICEGTTKSFNTVVNPTYTTTLTYNWTPNTYLSNGNIRNPIVDLNGTGTSTINYSLTVTDSKGCYTTVTPNATLVPAVTTSVVFTDTSVCAGNNITLLSSATGGTAPLTYTWTPGTGISDPSIANPIATVTQNRLYTITVSDTKGCSDAKTINVKATVVKVFFNPQLVTGYTTEPTLLTPKVNSSNYTYQWFKANDIANPSDDEALGTNLSQAVTEEGKYIVIATDPVSLCTSTDTVEVIIDPCKPRVVFVPNVFNPNSTNANLVDREKNNKIKIFGCDIKDQDFSFRIYNKWGQLIYETSDVREAQEKGWNGEYQGNGIDQNQAVYTYTLHGYFTSNGEEFDKTGSITLMR